MSVRKILGLSLVLTSHCGFMADCYPTAYASLRHQSVVLEENREGLEWHLAQGKVGFTFQMCVCMCIYIFMYIAIVCMSA